MLIKFVSVNHVMDTCMELLVKSTSRGRHGHESLVTETVSCGVSAQSSLAPCPRSVGVTGTGLFGLQGTQHNFEELFPC